MNGGMKMCWGGGDMKELRRSWREEKTGGGRRKAKNLCWEERNETSEGNK